MLHHKSIWTPDSNRTTRPVFYLGLQFVKLLRTQRSFDVTNKTCGEERIKFLSLKSSEKIEFENLSTIYLNLTDSIQTLIIDAKKCSKQKICGIKFVRLRCRFQENFHASNMWKIYLECISVLDKFSNLIFSETDLSSCRKKFFSTFPIYFCT